MDRFLSVTVMTNSEKFRKLGRVGQNDLVLQF